MKNVLRIAAVVLPLVCGANIAMAQAILEDAVVTGSEENTREFLGLPPLKDDGSITGDEWRNGEHVYKRHAPSTPHRTW
jgi:hypothetical protein